ncbi:MAG: RagB/SusD family nutrient uptake outer membrane protein [Bacteroidaceae bacterium]|nr:RagB/SusD family nutrient uptake outer membrane protein [Bacteroidaceae bacterium]MBQ8191356.1 RagB/SusD family nutrient uptake outer membrane protein [Bacteroidaceae bacterium]
MKAKQILFGFLTVIGAASCSEEMEYKEYNIYDKDYITQNFVNIGGFMTNLYNNVDYDFGNFSSGAMLASASDESEYSILGNGIEDFYNGAWSPSNAKESIPTGWTKMYQGISTVNYYLQDFLNETFPELEENTDYGAQLYRYNNYKYEARFMRAYYYFNLVRQYGDVPLVDKVLSAEEINQISRTPADSVFKFIIAECDAIKDLIIANYSDLGAYALSSEESGRADRLAVLALRARAALYWASPLFNPEGKKERYYDAALYTKELLEACKERGKGLTANYADLWSANSYNTQSIVKEIIFGRRYYSSSAGDHLVESYNYPVGIEGGNGGNCPTQNLVDAYDMTNGKSIDDPTSGYDPTNPYAGRDPRLAATVAINGSVWPSYQKEVLQTYQGGKNGQPLTGATTTGYYLKKYCNGSISLASGSTFQNAYHTWLTFRMGEFYLNYAEAVFNYLGSADATDAVFTMSAREAVSKTRVRAGLPELESGIDNNTFWTRYQKERMVELAFEGHRFWDVRRWKEADKYFTGITRMVLNLNTDGTIAYKKEEVSRQWNDKMYLFPIPQTEILKNPNLKQNTGW